ncbi:MAG: hypothetical protein HY542_04120 [Deltaproteobacteria bacterium]|nr:hypothetical protein [Deltaproteobacteria bacterium]
MSFDIREFRSEENLYRILQRVGNRDTKLEKGEIDQNKDGYLDYHPTFLASLSATEFSHLEGKLFQKSLLTRQRNPEETALIFDELKKKLPADLIDEKRGALFSEIPEIMNVAHESRSRIKRTVDLIGSTLAVHTPQSTAEVHQWARSVIFLIQHSKGYVRFMNQLVDELEIDWRRCNSREFAGEFAGKLNRYVERHPRPLKGPLLRAAKIINKVHDREIDRDPSDRMREEISARLAPRTAYLMMAVGGRNLYTTSFLTIWTQQKIGNVRTWLREVDPAERDVPAFVRRVSKFGLSSILKGEEDYFFQIGVGILEKTEEPIVDTTILTDLFESLIPTATVEAKRRLAEQFLRLYCSPKLDSAHRRSVGFLIKYFGDSLAASYPPIRELQSRLPAIPIPSIPRERWLEDRTLTAKLFFYDDSGWYQQTIDTCRTKMGWRIESKTDSRSVLTKVINGITLRMIIVHRSEGGEDRESFEGVDIIVHRGAQLYRAKDIFCRYRHAFGPTLY